MATNSTTGVTSIYTLVWCPFQMETLWITRCVGCLFAITVIFGSINAGGSVPDIPLPCQRQRRVAKSELNGAASILPRTQSPLLGRGNLWSSKKWVLPNRRHQSMPLLFRDVRRRLQAPRSPTSLGGIRNILGELETLWEIYEEREAIMAEIRRRGTQLLRRSGVKIVAVLLTSYAVAESLARLGVIGDKGEGLRDYVGDEMKDLKGRVEDYPDLIAQAGSLALDIYMNLSDRSKFAFAVSTGVLGARTVVSLAVASLKIGTVAFVALETMAYMGIIGEPGESIIEWVDDNKHRHRKLHSRVQKFRRFVRRKVNPRGLHELYDAVIEEEKVASFGFAAGAVVGVLAY